jgi:hypothetical protein
MVRRFRQFLTDLESLVAADGFGGKGTSAEAGTVPGRNATPANSRTVDFSMKVFAPWTAIIAHGSPEHTPPSEGCSLRR